ncbi:MAG: hypothetical protein ACYDD4_11235 [Acidimicrobiales bacterium]
MKRGWRTVVVVAAVAAGVGPVVAAGAAYAATSVSGASVAVSGPAGAEPTAGASGNTYVFQFTLSTSIPNLAGGNTCASGGCNVTVDAPAGTALPPGPTAADYAVAVASSPGGTYSSIPIASVITVSSNETELTFNTVMTPIAAGDSMQVTVTNVTNPQTVSSQGETAQVSTSSDTVPVVTSAYLIYPGAGHFFVSGPTTAQTAGDAIPITAGYEDQYGNPEWNSAAADPVTLTSAGGNGALACNPATVDLSGGLASFKSCDYFAAGSGYVVTATDGVTGDSASTQPITVTAAPASQLTLVFGPDAAGPGAVFVDNPVVAVEDVYGNIVTTATPVITLGVSGPGILQHCDSSQVTATGGIATFTNCEINGSLDPYELTAQASGFNSGQPSPVGSVTLTDSPYITFVPQAPPAPYFEKPASTSADLPIAVEEVDAHDNRVTSDNSLEVAPAFGAVLGTGAMTCSPFDGASLSNGTLTFSCASAIPGVYQVTVNPLPYDASMPTPTARVMIDGPAPSVTAAPGPAGWPAGFWSSAVGTGQYDKANGTTIDATAGGQAFVASLAPGVLADATTVSVFSGDPTLGTAAVPAADTYIGSVGIGWTGWSPGQSLPSSGVVVLGATSIQPGDAVFTESNGTFVQDTADVLNTIDGESVMQVTQPTGFVVAHPPSLGPATASGSGGQGYRLVAKDGGLFSYGMSFLGSMGGKPLNKPIVGLASDTDTGGYWEVASDGGIFAFGAPFYGSMGGQPLNAPVVGMASDPVTGGYWEVASDGGVFAFNAPFLGSMGGKPLNKPIVGMAYDPQTGGYWLVASDGGIFAFGAGFHGSMGGHPLDKPIVGMAANPATGGYWEVASDGGIFAFDAPFLGSRGGQLISAPIVGMAYDPTSGGYLMAGSDGNVYPFGGAAYLGSMAGLALAQPVVGIAS